MPTPAVGVPGQKAPPAAGPAPARAPATTHVIRFLLAAAIAAAAFVLPVVPAKASAAPPNSLKLPATYEVDVSLHWVAATMDVTSVAHVTNNTSDGIDALTFNLAALRLGTINLGDVLVDGNALGNNAVTVDDQSVIVALPNTLGPGDSTDVSIAYHAIFNSNTGGDRYLFAKSRGIITAYRWIPWLSIDQPFDQRPERESWVTGVSNHVKVTISSDRPVDIATSGDRVSATDSTTQTYVATNVRDFNFSAAPKYRIRTAHWRGVTIQLYFKHLSARSVLRKAKAALSAYADEIGPYPYSTLDIGEIPTGVGMESPGMVWLDGRLRGAHLRYIVAHELAHQWFYSAIGNNQGTDPFLDEAMADFLSRNLLDYWQNSRCGPENLDRSVWNYTKFCYYEVIYVQGSQYLRDYLNQVGPNAFWQGMQDFYSNYEFQVTNSKKLWQTLDAASGVDSSVHADRFPSDFASPSPSASPSPGPSESPSPSPSASPSESPSGSPSSSP